jgi:hypothetical protein
VTGDVNGRTTQAKTVVGCPRPSVLLYQISSEMEVWV